MRPSTPGVFFVLIKLFGVGRSHPLPKSRLAPSPGSIAWLPSLTRSPNAAATAHGQLRRTIPRSSSTIFKHSEVNPPNAQHQFFSSRAGTTPPKRSSNNTHLAQEGQPYAAAAAQGGSTPPSHPSRTWDCHGSKELKKNVKLRLTC